MREMTQLTRSFLKLSNRTHAEVTPEAMNYCQMEKKKKDTYFTYIQSQQKQVKNRFS